MNKTCQFPLWGEGKPSREFCGAPATNGSYCEHHHSVCYQGKNKSTNRQRIIKMLQGGIEPKDIPEALNVSLSYVYQIRNQLNAA